MNAPWLRNGLIAANLIGLTLIGVTLLVRLPLPTPHLDTAEERIRAQLEYAAPLSQGAAEYLAALAVTGYVNGHVSASLYGYRQAKGYPLPVDQSPERTAELALEYGAGICEQSMAAAMTLYERLGVRARRVDVLSPEDGHTTTEVWYGGAWHWFDPTFGYFYRDRGGDPDDVDSLVEVMSTTDPLREKVVAESRLWAQVTDETDSEAGNGLEVTALPIVWVVTADPSTGRREVLYTRGSPASG
jgi:hypothetical protein